jgi:hypothetical protein
VNWLWFGWRRGEKIAAVLVAVAHAAVTFSVVPMLMFLMLGYGMGQGQPSPEGLQRLALIQLTIAVLTFPAGWLAPLVMRNPSADADRTFNLAMMVVLGCLNSVIWGYVAVFLYRVARALYRVARGPDPGKATPPPSP